MALLHPSPVADPVTGPVVRVEPAGAGLRLVRGHQTVDLHPQWLRDRSTEPGQIDPSNRQRLFTPRDLPADLRVVHGTVAGDVLTVAFSDGHTARLSLTAILRALDWEADPDAPPPAEPWIGGPESLPVVDWAAIGWSEHEGDPAAVVAALDAFYRHGFVVIQNLPTVEGTVCRVGQRLGYVVGTNFGSVFDVRVEPDPTDLAYTSVELLAHTDLPYRQPAPGLQLLHCLANEAPGGESILADGMAAWHAIAAAEPDLHRALRDVEVAFPYDIGTDTVVNRGHVFEVDRSERFRAIRFNTKLDEPIVGSDGPGADLDHWYRGRRWLTDWLNDPANRVQLRLGAGDLLCFDNHRLLHGRSAFDSGAGRRHLQGCYIEHDGPDTLYRLSRRRLAGQD